MEGKDAGYVGATVWLQGEWRIKKKKNVVKAMSTADSASLPTCGRRSQVLIGLPFYMDALDTPTNTGVGATRH